MDYYFDGNLIESCDLVINIDVNIDLVLHFDRGFVSRNLHVFSNALILDDF